MEMRYQVIIDCLENIKAVCVVLYCIWVSPFPVWRELENSGLSLWTAWSACWPGGWVQLWYWELERAFEKQWGESVKSPDASSWMTNTWKDLPEERLNINNGLGISHVILLSDHGAFFVHHNHGVSKRHATTQKTVQTAHTVLRDQ